MCWIQKFNQIRAEKENRTKITPVLKSLVSMIKVQTENNYKSKGKQSGGLFHVFSCLLICFSISLNFKTHKTERRNQAYVTMAP